jgi:molybdate transport system permease protein
MLDAITVALVSVALSLPLAVAAAWALARGHFPGKGLLNLAVLLPLVLPPVVTGYALLILFGRQAPIGAFLENTLGLTLAFRWTGAALAAAVMGFPLMVRAIRIAIDAVDPRLEEAASTLGASRRAVFFTVTLPLIAPGILAGAILGFAKALGEFGATITFVASIPGETETLPSAIYTLLQVPGGETAALRLILLSVLLAIGAVALSEWISQRAAKRVQGR